MGTIVSTQYVDDLDGKKLAADAVVKVPFSYRGGEYEVELSAKNADLFDKDMQRWIDAANNAAGSAPASGRKKTATRARKSAPRTKAGTRRKTSSSPVPTLSREENRAIREWATANGYTVPQRGRIPGAIVDAYNAAP